MAGGGTGTGGGTAATYTGSASLVAAHTLFGSSGTDTAGTTRAGSAALSKSATIAGTATFAMPAYTGTMAAIKSHATIVSNSNTRTVPVFNGSSAVTKSHSTMTGVSVFIKPVYTGVVSVTKRAAFAANANFLPTYTGSAGLSKSATFSATAYIVSYLYTGTSAAVKSHATTSSSPVYYFGSPVRHANAAVVSSNASLVAAATFRPHIAYTVADTYYVRRQVKLTVTIIKGPIVASLTVRGNSPCQMKPSF